MSGWESGARDGQHVEDERAKYLDLNQKNYPPSWVRFDHYRQQEDGHVRLVDYHGSGSVWSRAAVLDFRAGEMGHSWIILGVSGSSGWE